MKYSLIILLLSYSVIGAQEPNKEFRLSAEEVASQQHRDQPQRPQFHYSPLQGGCQWFS
ncbi:MAG: hypothetical protein ACI9R3_001215 [Verrucomicrobiales bacterium]|jgi:hypothetical protein